MVVGQLVIGRKEILCFVRMCHYDQHVNLSAIIQSGWVLKYLLTTRNGLYRDETGYIGLEGLWSVIPLPCNRTAIIRSEMFSCTGCVETVSCLRWHGTLIYLMKVVKQVRILIDVLLILFFIWTEKGWQNFVPNWALIFLLLILTPPQLGGNLVLIIY